MAETFEQVDRVRAGFDDDGVPLWETTMTGRTRKPTSVPEWCAQRIAAMGVVGRALPGGRAVIALLEAGEDFDVKSAGRELDDWRRWGVRTELERLLGLGARELPSRRAAGAPGAPGVEPRVRQPRADTAADATVPVQAARRAASMADDPPDPPP